MMLTRKKTWLLVREIALVVLIIAIAFVASRAVNSWLGQRAFDDTRLEDVPFDVALERSLQEQKHLMLGFSATWCSSCRRLDKEVLGETRVNQKIRSDYIFARLDYDLPEERRIFEQYGVQGFPLIIVMEPGGLNPRALSTTFDPEQFLLQL